MNRYAWLGVLVGVFACGCSGSDWPDTAAVRGTITRDGKPVANATVSFQAPGAARYGYGTTDSNGRYTLSTFGANDGAVLGTHAVVVAPDNSLSEPSTDLSIDMSDPKNYEAYVKAVQAADKPVKNPAVPPRFGSPATTPLTATVKPGDNVIDFDLSDD